MLLCLVISGQLWIGDSQRLFPTQGDYYFHKFQDSITIYSVGGIRRGSVAIPKEMNGETIAEVFINCSKDTESAVIGIGILTFIIVSIIG